MKKHEKLKMIWNVYREDYNQKIIIYNIFEHYHFNKDVKEIMNKKLQKIEFEKELRQICKYYFWGRTEYEMLISSCLPCVPKDKMNKMIDEWEQYHRKNGHFPYNINVEIECAIKINIYNQIELNWDSFVEYVFSKI